MIADIQVGAPALHVAMIEICLHVLGVRRTTLPHKGQDLLGARLHLRVPYIPGGAWRSARMQQGMGRTWQEPVVDEETLFDRQARIAALQFAGAIVLDAVGED